MTSKLEVPRPTVSGSDKFRVGGLSSKAIRNLPQNKLSEFIDGLSNTELAKLVELGSDSVTEDYRTLDPARAAMFDKNSHIARLAAERISSMSTTENQITG